MYEKSQEWLPCNWRLATVNWILWGLLDLYNVCRMYVRILWWCISSTRWAGQQLLFCILASSKCMHIMTKFVTVDLLWRWSANFDHSLPTHTYWTCSCPSELASDKMEWVPTLIFLSEVKMISQWSNNTCSTHVKTSSPSYCSFYNQL